MVGLTDQLVQQRIDRDDYDRWCAELEGHVASLGNNDMQDMAEDEAEEGGTTVYRKPLERLRITKKLDFRCAGQQLVGFKLVAC